MQKYHYFQEELKKGNQKASLTQMQQAKLGQCLQARQQ